MSTEDTDCFVPIIHKGTSRKKVDNVEIKYLSLIVVEKYFVLLKSKSA